ncbi:ABC transporter substrate-binding protein [Nocardioides marinquilinus]|uniref:ABC transporter substrate-binding protein n=1 Tax=Nocardioides marinquilinus TaxID=1210400 RepID=A0ABP9PIT9_9ACTN
MLALVLVVAGGIGVAVAVTRDDDPDDGRDDAGPSATPTPTEAPSTEPTDPTDPTEPTDPTASPSEPTGGPERDGEVTVLASVTGADLEGLRASLAGFEERSGITVAVQTDVDLASTVTPRLQAGDPPGVVLFPQPGLLRDLAAGGLLAPIEEYLDPTVLESSLVPGGLDGGRVDGVAYGVPVRLVGKSLVWYPRRLFAQGGYEEPGTLDELTALTRRLERDGVQPWCQGWESGPATGWVGSDWLEQYVLTREGGDLYRSWAAHEVPYDAPRVVAALKAYGRDVVRPGSPAGDRALTTPFGDAFRPAFDRPPGCALERQGSFVTEFLTEETGGDPDGRLGVFAYPAADGRAAPAVVSGDVAALTDPTDGDAIDLLTFLSAPEFGEEWAATGLFVSPHRDFDARAYPDATTRRVADLTTSASEVVWDASDAMPGDLATLSWTALVEWLAGAPARDALGAVEDAWPR